MFVIKRNSTGEYFHKDRQIILYESPEQAKFYLESFIQYAIQRALTEIPPQERNPFTIMEIQSEIMNCSIMPIDFDIEKQSHVKTIWMHKLEN